MLVGMCLNDGSCMWSSPVDSLVTLVFCRIQVFIRVHRCISENDERYDNGYY